MLLFTYFISFYQGNFCYLEFQHSQQNETTYRIYYGKKL